MTPGRLSARPRRPVIRLGKPPRETDRSRLDNVEDLLPEGLDRLLGTDRPVPRIIPEPRYFSIPSINWAPRSSETALERWAWARSLIHSPDRVIHSPAEMMAA